MAAAGRPLGLLMLDAFQAVMECLCIRAIALSPTEDFGRRNKDAVRDLDEVHEPRRSRTAQADHAKISSSLSSQLSLGGNLAKFLFEGGNLCKNGRRNLQ